MRTLILSSKSKKKLHLIEELALQLGLTVHKDNHESPYNPEFVQKIKQAEREKGKIMESAAKLWENL
jgi:hypothetical protein